MADKASSILHFEVRIFGGPAANNHSIYPTLNHEINNAVESGYVDAAGVVDRSHKGGENAREREAHRSSLNVAQDLDTGQQN
jgi:hypothetical protein